MKDLKTQKTLFEGRCENGLYPLHFQSKSSSLPQGSFACFGARVASSVWHVRLGHPTATVLSHLISNKSLPISGTPQSSSCNSCPLGKSHKLPFSLSDSVSHFPLELLHSDVWTSPTISNRGFKYYLIFVDDFQGINGCFL